MRTEEMDRIAFREATRMDYPKGAGANSAPIKIESSKRRDSSPEEVTGSLQELMNMENERIARERAEAEQAKAEAEERKAEEKRSREVEEIRARDEKFRARQEASRAAEEALAKRTQAAALRSIEIERARQTEEILRNFPENLRKAYLATPEIELELAKKILGLGDFLHQVIEIRNDSYETKTLDYCRRELRAIAEKLYEHLAALQPPQSKP